MARRWGSWLPLLVVAIAFLLLFCWQRSRSTFLQIEQERAFARDLTHAYRDRAPGVAVADVLALRDMVGLDADVSDWVRATSDFAHRVEEARRSVDLKEAIVAAIRGLTNDDVAIRRFLLMRERFAARS